MDWITSNTRKQSRTHCAFVALGVTVQKFLDAILSGTATARDFADLEVPETYSGLTVHADEVDMFNGLDTVDKDPRRSLHLEEVPTPELGPGEALSP